MVLAWLLPFAHYLFWSILQVRFDTVLPMSRVLNHRKKKSVIRKKNNPGENQKTSSRDDSGNAETKKEKARGRHAGLRKNKEQSSPFIVTEYNQHSNVT